MPKSKAPKVDGLSRKDIERIRKACRQVWSWSYPRRLCIQRAMGKDGFPRCEGKSHVGNRRVPKVHPDHIIPVGKVDAGFLRRLFCPSKELQALCGKCHRAKTKAERECAALGYAYREA